MGNCSARSLLEERLADGVIARALEEAPHRHAYDRADHADAGSAYRGCIPPSGYTPRQGAGCTGPATARRGTRLAGVAGRDLRRKLRG